MLEQLAASRGGEFLDCTLGGGGHTAAILACDEKNTVVALDRDTRAIDRAKQRLSVFKERVEFIKGSFSEVGALVSQRKFDGVLADLGLSTDQLYEERGFSFNDEQSLDMRMDEEAHLTASTIVNTYDERALFEILKRGGVGSEAKPVCRSIIRARPIASSKELARVINTTSVPRRGDKRINPATVVFQAIRMAVNDELGEIEQLMEAVPALVKDGGRFAVITFHSLEDRIVAGRMREWEAGDTAPASWPMANRKSSMGKMLSRKAIVPTDEEIERNPSSRSARLRIFQFFH